jgi:hypothetical protein
MPVRLASVIAGMDNPEAPLFHSIGRRKDAAELEEANARRAIAHIPREDFDQIREQTRPERHVIFTQRITKGDRAFREQSRLARNQSGRAHFGESARDQALPQGGFKIVSAIGFRFRSEPAAILQRDTLDAKHAHDFLDQVGFALKIGAKTGDLPGNFLVVGLHLLQTEPFEDLPDALLWH